MQSMGHFISFWEKSANLGESATVRILYAIFKCPLLSLFQILNAEWTNNHFLSRFFLYIKRDEFSSTIVNYLAIKSQRVKGLCWHLFSVVTDGYNSTKITSYLHSLNYGNTKILLEKFGNLPVAAAAYVTWKAFTTTQTIQLMDPI